MWMRLRGDARSVGTDNGTNPWLKPVPLADLVVDAVPEDSATPPVGDPGASGLVSFADAVAPVAAARPVPSAGQIPSWEVLPRPHLGGPERQASAEDVAKAGWWWLGVHGGAGVSTLTEFVPGGLDAFRWWPAPLLHEGPGAVILVCRTHAAGLTRARDAVRQWQAGEVPEGLLLGGLVAIADAPGKLPRPQAEMLRLIAGAVPRSWTVPWLDELRLTDDLSTLSLPPALVRLSLDLEALRHRFGSVW